MQEKYDKCPICNGNFFIVDTAGHLKGGYATYNCNNEKEIIFAKARRTPIPEYHSFSYRNEDGIIKWILQFNISPKKIIRLVRHSITDVTAIQDRYGKIIIRIEAPLEPDFPALEKLRYKIKTYLNFS